MVRRPSPTFVVACLARAVAIGGTAWAAALPRTGVGARERKADAG